MQNLKETLESFSLSEDTRRKILNEDHPFGNQGTPFIPSEFKEIAHQRPHRISSQPQERFSQENLQIGHPAQPCFWNRHHVREGHSSRRCHQDIPADT